MIVDDLGCSTNALSVLDKACTNKASCEYLIPNELILISCSKEFASLYLEANYECYEGKMYPDYLFALYAENEKRSISFNAFFVVVSPPKTVQCSESRPLEVTATTGYISSESVNCPWRLIGQPGQRINITLIDTDPQATPGHCESIGIVRDLRNNKDITVCKSTNRKQHIHYSNGPKLEMQLISESDSFLIYFEGKVVFHENISPSS